MLTRPVRASLLGLVTLAGCQAPDISAELDAYVARLNGVNFRLCDCPDLLGYQTKTECDEALGSVGATHRDCLESVLDGYEAESQDHLVCLNDALADYEQCLVANVDCEASAGDSCAQAQTSAIAACPSLPSEVRSAFAACTP